MDDCYSRAKTFLDSGREVLFTGTPCQIAGLKHFLRKDYPNLLTVEVICHGVPSPAVWQKFLKELSERLGRDRCDNIKSQSIVSKNCKTGIKRISFRDKRLGWKRFGFALDAVGNHDTSESCHNNYNYFEPFERTATCKHSCATGRSGPHVSSVKLKAETAILTSPSATSGVSKNGPN